MSDKVRVLRILEYVGNREWIEETLSTGNVPARGQKVSRTQGVIKSSIVGDFPEVVDGNDEMLVNLNETKKFTVVTDYDGGDTAYEYTLYDENEKLVFKTKVFKELQIFAQALGYNGMQMSIRYENKNLPEGDTE